MNRSALKGLGIVLVVGAAFAAGRYGRGPAEPPLPAGPAPAPPASTTVPPSDTGAVPQPTRACVGPGSTREQVQEALGEPDSIVGGWWHYGRSQFHLGSGIVQDYITPGGLPLC